MTPGTVPLRPPVQKRPVTGPGGPGARGRGARRPGRRGPWDRAPAPGGLRRAPPAARPSASRARARLLWARGQVDAGVGLGGGRGIVQAEGGVAERHAGRAAGRRASRQPGVARRVPVGVEGEQVLVRSRRRSRPAGAAIRSRSRAIRRGGRRGPAVRRRSRASKVNVTGISARAVSAANSGRRADEHQPVGGAVDQRPALPDRRTRRAG